MNKKIATILIVVAFFSGVIGGGGIAACILNHGTMRLIYLTEISNAETDVALLNRIRSNHASEAVAVLETKLDGSLGLLGLYFKDIPKSERVQALKTLQRVKEYRDRFPYTNDYTEINLVVSNAFSLLVTNQ